MLARTKLPVAVGVLLLVGVLARAAEANAQAIWLPELPPAAWTVVGLFALVELAMIVHALVPAARRRQDRVAHRVAVGLAADVTVPGATSSSACGSITLVPGTVTDLTGAGAGVELEAVPEMFHAGQHVVMRLELPQPAGRHRRVEATLEVASARPAGQRRTRIGGRFVDLDQDVRAAISVFTYLRPQPLGHVHRFLWQRHGLAGPTLDGRLWCARLRPLPEKHTPSMSPTFLRSARKPGAGSTQLPSVAAAGSEEDGRRTSAA